jgi:undecaprenyl-diphosphatase
MKIVDQRLLAARYGVRVGLGSALALLAAVLLGVHYAHTSTPGRLDRAVDRWFGARLPEPIAHGFVYLGDPPVVAFGVLLVAGLCARARFWRGAVLVVAATGVASILAEWVLKPSVGRTLHGGLAYPSGHTVGTLSFALAVALLLGGAGRQVLSRRAAAATATALVVLSVLCMAGLIASNYHYATDVLGGFCLAAGCTGLVSLAVDAAFARA